MMYEAIYQLKLGNAYSGLSLLVGCAMCVCACVTMNVASAPSIYSKRCKMVNAATGHHKLKLFPYYCSIGSYYKAGLLFSATSLALSACH